MIFPRVFLCGFLNFSLRRIRPYLSHPDSGRTVRSCEEGFNKKAGPILTLPLVFDNFQSVLNLSPSCYDPKSDYCFGIVCKAISETVFSTAMNIFPLGTRHNLNRIASFYGSTLHSLALQNAFGIPAFEPSVTSVEVTNQVF